MSRITLSILHLTKMQYKQQTVSKAEIQYKLLILLVSISEIRLDTKYLG